MAAEDSAPILPGGATSSSYGTAAGGRSPAAHSEKAGAHFRPHAEAESNAEEGDTSTTKGTPPRPAAGRYCCGRVRSGRGCALVAAASVALAVALALVLVFPVGRAVASARLTAAAMTWPVNIWQNTFSDRTHYIAQLRPGSSFLLSVPRFLDRLQAVTQARASGDYHPGNDQWKPLGLTGIFAHAVGIKPTKDNFWTKPVKGWGPKYHNARETANRLQAVVSTLSTGPVAISDRIGQSDVGLILRSCAADGTLLQPDRPATRTDATLYRDAGLKGTGPQGEVWTTHVRLGARHGTPAAGHYACMYGSDPKDFPCAPKYHYLLAVESQPYAMTAGEWLGADAALAPNGYVAWETNATDAPVRLGGADAALALPATDKLSFVLWTAAPVLGNGWAFMGEASTKWVAVSNDRFGAGLMVEFDTGLQVTAQGQAGEVIRVMALAPGATVPTTVDCTVPESGSVMVVLGTSPMVAPGAGNCIAT